MQTLPKTKQLIVEYHKRQRELVCYGDTEPAKVILAANQFEYDSKLKRWTKDIGDFESRVVQTITSLDCDIPLKSTNPCMWESVSSDITHTLKEKYGSWLEL